MEPESRDASWYRAQFLQPSGSTNREFRADFPIWPNYQVHISVNDRVLSGRQYVLMDMSDGDITVTLSDIPRAGDVVTIWISPEETSVASFLPGQSVQNASINAQILRLIDSVTAIRNRAVSALRFAKTDVLMAQNPMPPVETRAGKVLGFDPDGKLVAEVAPPPAMPALERPWLLDGSPESDLPLTRPGDLALRAGDLVREVGTGVLLAWAGESWRPSYSALSDFLPRDGEIPMTGPLQLANFAVMGAGRIAGRSIGTDGDDVENLNRHANASLVHLADLAERNAWDLATVQLSPPGAVANLYLDDFATAHGIASGKNGNMAIWDDQDCGTVFVRQAGRQATQSGSSSSFQYIAAHSSRPNGRFYVEFIHTKTKPVASAYTWHGLRLVGTTAVSGNPPPEGYVLCANDGDVFDGYSELPRGQSFTEAWPANHVGDGAVGTLAVDIDRGEVWLGFVTPDLSTWWHGDGDPESGERPTSRFQPGAAVALACGLWGAEPFEILLNAGQESFAGSVPKRFRAGWHDGDADNVVSDHVDWDAESRTCRPVRTTLATLNPNVDWTQTPHWYGYRNPIVSQRAHIGRSSWLLETGGGGSPTMLHRDWSKEQNQTLINATHIEVCVSVASSHMTFGGAGYGTNLQTGWVDDHDAPAHHMRLGAYLLAGSVQSLVHPGGSLVNPCPHVALANDTWYDLTWRLTKPAGFAASTQSLEFLIDGDIAWTGSFTANPALAVENGIWAGSNDGLQYFHQHDGYPYWTSALSAWSVRTSFDTPQPMSLISRPVLCEGVPEKVRLLAEVGNLSGLAENQDFAFSVRRADGSDWLPLPVSKRYQTGIDRWICEGEVDLAGTAEGTRLRVRLQTFNQSAPVLHRWLFAADTPFYQ